MALLLMNKILSPLLQINIIIDFHTHKTIIPFLPLQHLLAAFQVPTLALNSLVIKIAVSTKKFHLPPSHYPIRCQRRILNTVKQSTAAFKSNSVLDDGDSDNDGDALYELDVAPASQVLPVRSLTRFHLYPKSFVPNGNPLPWDSTVS